MPDVTFITGNDDKAEILRKHLGHKIERRKLDLDEIQSLDLHKIVEHKVKQAYEAVKSPVLVEDVALRLDGLGGLPGPLIKWFLQELGPVGVCKLADIADTRAATAEVCYGYYDGKILKFFDGRIKGNIAARPTGDGFGWNPTFIPDGSTKTYAQMDEEESARFSLRPATVYPELREFLNKLDKIS